MASEAETTGEGIQSRTRSSNKISNKLSLPNLQAPSSQSEISTVAHTTGRGYQSNWGPMLDLMTEDYIRGEKMLWVFFTQFHRGELTTLHVSRMDETYSLCELPVWRGQESKFNEIVLDISALHEGEVKEAMRVLPKLPELSYECMACHELMMPLNKRFEPLVQRGHNWSAIRHKMRRVSMRPGIEHPFERLHAMTDEELFEIIPNGIKRYLDACEECDDVKDIRERFTRGVLFWPRYHKSIVEPAVEPEQWPARDRMDEFIASEKGWWLREFSV